MASRRAQPGALVAGLEVWRTGCEVVVARAQRSADPLALLALPASRGPLARLARGAQVFETMHDAGLYPELNRIAFFVRTNPGTEAGPMMKVASGGELSRFMLAFWWPYPP